MKTSHHWKESHNEKLHFMNSAISHSGHHHPGAHDSHKPVSFFCAAPHAQSVELAGDFNQWQPFPMKRSVDGWWLAQVELTHGHHQYRFLVDGEPMLDPHATGVVRDEHGNQTSLIAVS
jgi:1,4-alpha-glucan branching enzyme